MLKVSSLLQILFPHNSETACQHSPVKKPRAGACSASDRKLSTRDYSGRENGNHHYDAYSTSVSVLSTQDHALTQLPDYPWQPNNL